MREYLDTDEIFGSRLREERERLGLQLHELAHLGGVVEVTQGHYEAGKKPIPIGYLQALEWRTNASIVYLLPGKR